MAQAIGAYFFAAMLFLAVLCFGAALALAPLHSTIRGWRGRSDFENALRVAGSALGLYFGLAIVLGAIERGLFPRL